MSSLSQNLLLDATGGTLLDGVHDVREATHHAIERHIESIGKHHSPRFSSKTKKSAATRERIIKAASKLIMRRVGTNFQMSEISEMCHMSKGALYYYFRNRDDLVEAVFSQALEDFSQRLREVGDGAESACDALCDICDAFEQSLIGEGTLVLAVIRELLQARDNMLPQIEERFGGLTSIICDQVERGKREGLISESVDSELAASMLCGCMSFATISASLREGRAAGSESLGTTLFRQLMEGIGVR